MIIMKIYDYFKFMFIMIIAIGFGISQGYIDQQQNEIDNLIFDLNQSIQVSNDLFNIVEKKQTHINNLNTQAELQAKQYKILLDKNKDINEEYNILFNEYKRDVLIDTMIIKPTYQQVLSFLARDHTDLKTHTWAYDCTEFSNKLIANARDEGIFACTTELVYLDGIMGHILVAFNTIDRGIIYVEPQNDDILTKDFGVGNSYWNEKIVKISSCWD